MIKEDILDIVNTYPEGYNGEIIVEHLIDVLLKNEDNYKALDLFNKVHKLIYNKILKEIHYASIINERAKYLETYLDNKMYNEDSEEYKKNKDKYREIQKEHATYINKLSEDLIYNNGAARDLNIMITEKI